MTVAFSNPISREVIKRQKTKVHYLRTKSEKPSLADNQIRRVKGITVPFRPNLIEVELLGKLLSCEDRRAYNERIKKDNERHTIKMISP